MIYNGKQLTVFGNLGGGYTRNVLWQNNASGAFTEQELTLPNDEYDAIEIVYKSAIDDPFVSTSGAIPLVEGYASFCCLHDTDGTVKTMVSVRKNDTDTRHELEFWFNLKDVEVCPPHIIYGIKY